MDSLDKMEPLEDLEFPAKKVRKESALRENPESQEDLERWDTRETLVSMDPKENLASVVR